METVRMFLDVSQASTDEERFVREVANLCAAAFQSAGRSIRFPCSLIDPDLLAGDAQSVVLHFALELRNTLMRSANGRQALSDLGFELAQRCGESE